MQIIQSCQNPSPTNVITENFSEKWIWLKVHKPGSSLAPRYVGPYEVLQVNYPVITIKKNGVPYNVNRDRVKPAWTPINLKGQIAQNRENSSETEDSEEENDMTNDSTRKSSYGRIIKQTNPFQAGFN